MKFTLDDSWYIRHSAGSRGIELSRESAEAFLVAHGAELQRRLDTLRNAHADQEKWLDQILREWTAAATTKEKP